MGKNQIWTKISEWKVCVALIHHLVVVYVRTFVISVC